MKNIKLSILLILVIHTPLSAKIQVVTTSTDLASIAKEVGGNLVNVKSLAEGNMDLHFVPAQPDFISKVNKADVFIEIGLDLEIGWTPRVLHMARNTQVMPGNKGYCNTSKGIKIMLPSVKEVNRSMGDMHAKGNPHYWADPVYGVVIARNIRDVLTRVDPKNGQKYNQNLKRFAGKVKSLMAEVETSMKQHRGKSLVVYHKEFMYLFKRFGISTAMSIEEKPGVPPGPAHFKQVVDYIKQNSIPAVVVAPWSNVGLAKKVAKEANVKLIILPVQTGSDGNSRQTYLEMMKKTITLLSEALSG